MAVYMLAGFHSVSMAEFVTTPTDLGIGYNCPCQEQFTKSMWWSILYSSAELLPDCPYLYLFSDEDWRRLNLFPKLKSRIRNGEQFRKLIALTRHSFRTHISDEVTQL